MGTDNDKKKGFAGLDSMVSTVEPGQPKREEPDRSRQPHAAESGRPAEIFQGQPAPSGGSSGKWWLLGIGAIAFLAWIGASGSKDSPQKSSFAAQAPATTSSNRTSSGGNVARSGPAETPKPAADTEERPPVGNGLVLNRAQIRYCLAEDIRMSAWQTQVDNYSSSSVDAFNRAVNDYNSRCSNFRYRSGTLESARTQVEAERNRLVRQGLAMAAANP